MNFFVLKMEPKLITYIILGLCLTLYFNYNTSIQHEDVENDQKIDQDTQNVRRSGRTCYPPKKYEFLVDKYYIVVSDETTIYHDTMSKSD
jgi:hypothetical protein